MLEITFTKIETTFTVRFAATYSSACNPNIVTEFASAAFRIGHSLLRPHLPRMNTQYQPVEPAILLRDVFFNPDVIHQVKQTSFPTLEKCQ